MGASMALAGLAGCTKQPDEPIYPYIKAPEDLILGKPMYFATAHPFPTGAVPLLVKSDEFRPIKIDGNPEHAYNHGGSDPYSQGTLLDLYDPDRSQHVLISRREPGVGRVCRGVPRKSGLDQRWNRNLLPERHHYLAHAGAAVAGGAEGLAQGEAGAIRSGAGRNVSGERDERSVRPEPGGRDRFARRGFSFGRELIPASTSWCATTPTGASSRKTA